MKPSYEMKVPKKSVINLEPVQLQVQLSQKCAPFANNFQIHINAKGDAETAQQYDHILTETIENIIIAISDNEIPDLQQLASLSTINKTKISYIAVLNLQIIQKLSFILEKCQRAKANFDLQFLQSQIRYWRQFVYFALTDISQEIQRHGKITNAKKSVSKKQQQLKKAKSGEQIIHELKSQSEWDEKQPIIASKIPRRKERLQEMVVQNNNSKPTKVTRKRSSNKFKNGEHTMGNQINCDNIDSQL